MIWQQKRVSLILILLVAVVGSGTLWLFFQRPHFSVVPGTDVIVFTRDDELGAQLYAATVDGTQQARITENIERIAWWLPLPNPFGSVTFNTHPSHIQNSNDVVFMSDLGVGQSLYRVGIDGRNQRPLAARVGFNIPINAFPSPNLSWIALPNPDGTLHVVRLDGSGDTCVTCTIADRVSAPAWSPTSQQLAFSASVDGVDEVYVVDVDGTNLRRLTPAHVKAFEPAWSSDGSRIAFVSSFQNTARLFVMNSDGTQLRQVTRDPIDGSVPMSERFPVWSSDDTQIAFIASPNNQADIFVTNLATGTVRRVTTLGKVSDPTWVRVQP